MLELPNGWAVETLPIFCNVRTGKKDANHANEQGVYRFYTCSRKYSFCDTFSFCGKCVIVPGNGDIGLVFYYDGSFEAYQRTYVLENICILPKYLYYHFLWNWRHINTNKQYGTTVRYVRISNFYNYVVRISPCAEQHRIVAKIDALFSELDKGIEILQIIRQQLRMYRQAVLKWAFEGAITNTEMSPAKLGDYIEKPRYGTSKKCLPGLPNSGDVCVLRIPNVDYHLGVIDYSDVKYASFNDEEKSALMLRENDILLIRSNGSVSLVGRAAIIRKHDASNLFAGYLIRLRVTNQQLLSRYLLFYLSSPNARIYIERIAKSTSGVNNINAKEIESIPINVCSVNEQKDIVAAIESRLSICDKLLQIVDENLNKAQALKQSILKKAFAGQLVQQDTNDESASILLERIKAEQKHPAVKAKTKGGRKNG